MGTILDPIEPNTTGMHEYLGLVIRGTYLVIQSLISQNTFLASFFFFLKPVYSICSRYRVDLLEPNNHERITMTTDKWILIDYTDLCETHGWTGRFVWYFETREEARRFKKRQSRLPSKLNGRAVPTLSSPFKIYNPMSLTALRQFHVDPILIVMDEHGKNSKRFCNDSTTKPLTSYANWLKTIRKSDRLPELFIEHRLEHLSEDERRAVIDVDMGMESLSTDALRMIEHFMTGYSLVQQLRKVVPEV